MKDNVGSTMSVYCNNPWKIQNDFGKLKSIYGVKDRLVTGQKTEFFEYIKCVETRKTTKCVRLWIVC